MKLNHSQAPWLIDWTGDGYRRISGSDGHGEIARVKLRETKTNNVAELDANAHLLGAAPELLEAALWVVKLHGTDDPQGLLDLKEKVRDLRAAVSKALGK